jgi:hypothetical protein
MWWRIFALGRLWSTAHHTHLGAHVETQRKLALSLVVPLFFIAMWSIPKLQRNFVINYKWHLIPVLDMCTVFQDVIIFLIMLTPYLECHWVSFSVSEYVAECTILSRVESRVTCMTRSNLVAQNAWAESLYTSPQLRCNSSLILCSWGYLVEWSAAISKKGTWRWEVQGKVSFVHGADSKQVIFLILLKSFMVGKHWVLCWCYL